MPFDSIGAPQEWRPRRAEPEPERALSGRDVIVAVLIAAPLIVIALANAKALLDVMHGG